MHLVARAVRARFSGGWRFHTQSKCGGRVILLHVQHCTRNRQRFIVRESDDRPSPEVTRLPLAYTSLLRNQSGVSGITYEAYSGP